MKTISLLFIFAGLHIAQGQPVFSHYESFDVNMISAFVRNDGLLHHNRNPATGTSGLEWPKGSGIYAIYASTPWFAAKVHGEVRVAAKEWGSAFSPGPMNAATHMPSDRSDSTFRVYRIDRYDSASWDYQHWPSSLGAPVRSDGKPQVFGDQTLWCVYNCAASTDFMSFDTKPLGVEVQQTVFGYNSLGSLFDNLMIVRYVIINKSENQLDSMYFGFWSDPDIGDPSDDNDGCDSTMSLWYCYNATDNDALYGLHPPAVGYITLQGPRVTSASDSGSFKGRFVRGFKNLPMTSFVLWHNAFEFNPRTTASLYSYFQAYWWGLGQHITYGGQGTDPSAPPTNFMYSGDPETGTGWLSAFSRHEFSGSGPFTMVPGDTQEVVMGILVSRGASNTNSVTKLRNETQVLSGYYHDWLYKLFAPPTPYVPPHEIPELYHLSQNYPNPFNPGTDIRFDLPRGEQVTLTVNTVLGQRIAVLASGFYPAGSYTVRWEPASAATGVYVYQLEAGRYMRSRRMLLLK